MTISTNIHLLWPVFTIQGDTGLKVENILSRFLPANKWKKKSQILCFLRICRSQFRALSNYLQLKNFFSFFDLLSKSSHRVHGTRLACFALFFMHGHESVKCKSVSREMYTFLEVKLWRLRRKTYEVNDIRDKNPTDCKQF